VRPLGAILFGSVADVWGRKATLVTTLMLMGTATTLIGCLPTYQHIGPAAPALLAILRVCMGLSLGAEYTTAVRRLWGGG
jgi:MFS family permease